MLPALHLHAYAFKELISIIVGEISLLLPFFSDISKGSRSLLLCPFINFQMQTSSTLSSALTAPSFHALDAKSFATYNSHSAPWSVHVKVATVRILDPAPVPGGDSGVTALTLAVGKFALFSVDVLKSSRLV